MKGMIIPKHPLFVGGVDTGIVIDNAYTTVTFFAADQGGSNKLVRWVWSVYKDKASHDAGLPPIGVREYTPSGDSADLAKSQPDAYAMVLQLLKGITLATKDVVVDPADLSKNKSWLDGAVDVV